MLFQRNQNKFINNLKITIIMQTTPSSQSVFAKVAAMFILLVIELIINSFVQSSFDLSSQSIFYINFYFLPIQLVITAFIFIMMLVMMWQTFPLRYGLVTTLLKQFKWTFAIVLVFVCITGAQRGIKLAYVVTDQSSFSQMKMFQLRGYLVLYYIRFILYPVFYAVLINFTIKIIDPIYYKPNKWLN